MPDKRLETGAFIIKLTAFLGVRKLTHPHISLAKLYSSRIGTSPRRMLLRKGSSGGQDFMPSPYAAKRRRAGMRRGPESTGEGRRVWRRPGPCTQSSEEGEVTHIRRLIHIGRGRRRKGSCRREALFGAFFDEPLRSLSWESMPRCCSG